jgi:ParB family chromosome partitioning protein
MTSKKNRLGRGLEDIIGRGLEDIVDRPKGLDKILPSTKNETAAPAAPTGAPLLINLKLIDPNPFQPRRDFKDLSALSQSIQAKGIIEPVVVSPKADGRYELIAGERRLKAAELAKLEEIPVVIRNISDDPADRLVLALLENLCREDLNPIEEANSFARLEKDFDWSHQKIAVMTGRERSTITNSIRLLKLPDFVQTDIQAGRLSAGHGRAMLGLSDPNLFQELRTEILAKNLTVRQTEALVRRLNHKPASSSPLSGSGADLIYYDALASNFSQSLGGLKVKIKPTGPQPKIEIYYDLNAELEELMKKLAVKPV